MNPTPLLNRLNEASVAQKEMNLFCRTIYNEYIAEIIKQKKALNDEFPREIFDDTLSDLERCNRGYSRYNIIGGELELVGLDYFRCEENEFEDRVPISLLTAPSEDRRALIAAFVGEKAFWIRKRILDDKKAEEQRCRDIHDMVACEDREKSETTYSI